METPHSTGVVAVVVSYNRRNVLVRCLSALVAQTLPPDRIMVIDNASTDGSADAVAHAFPSVELIRLTQNTGGAGGFALGMALAIKSKEKYAWLMDDDVIPDPGALEALIDGLRAYPEPAPALATCKVLGTTRQLGPRNHTMPAAAPYSQLVSAAERGHLAIRACTFVAPLIDLDAARNTHLPLADFFIWHDDTEYTSRLCGLRGGIMVPTSTVVHLAAQPAPGSDLGPRLYFDVRNRIWLARNADVFPLSERLRWLRSAMNVIRSQAKVAQDKRRFFVTVAKSCLDAVRSQPRREDANTLLARLDSAITDGPQRATLVSRTRPRYP